MAQPAHRPARFEPPFARIPLDQIGGGKVVRPFRVGGTRVAANTVLTAEQIHDMRAANRQVLLDRFIRVWPLPAVKGRTKGFASSARPESGAEHATRHVVSLGFRKYAVIEGVKLGEYATRAEAYKAAGKPDPKGD